MTRYFIGIDNGSQSSKVTVFDTHGRTVSEGRQALRPYDTPRPGVVEHPGDDLWESITAAARQAMDAFPGDPADIAGVGLCTIRFCRAVLRDDGTLAQPVMSWMDERVGRPYEAVDPAAAYVTTSSGYLTHRMTGQFRDTAANYAGIWPLDPLRCDWSQDPTAFEKSGMPREMLLDLVQPGDVLGRVTADCARATGIPEGLPVVATANDKAVEALGCGLDSPDTLLLSLGTYVAGMAVGDRYVSDASAFWTNYACLPGAYLYESEGVRRGMWTVSWYRDLLGEEAAAGARAAGLSVEDHLNAEAAKVPPGSDGLLTVLDWLAPDDAPFRRGSILGFDGRQGRYHVYRSILEGLALTLGAAGHRMADELGGHYDELVVSGGGSHSDLMMGILADVFGVPARRAGTDSAAGLGAAICAAVACGAYADFPSAVSAMVHPGATFRPDAERHALYERLGAVYETVRSHTDAVYRQLG
ncbi:Autoinducer 2 kinase LsrK [Streptomyces sp. YIM 130001]|uniref:FGGY-family carbohydrate kinase n=1 Tax=Streptomyces sp. YIM 130001 TaxID=2259644 RepID=UPI000E64DB3E|nr:FGGY-family carbohydrate kinase [Streptomyces sp. YIM 130001]RII15878.1 Autoinducer 2 kinase LsrK [Streptomyces sp. YIM 130001]